MVFPRLKCLKFPDLFMCKSNSKNIPICFIRFEEGLTPRISALETTYGSQFTFSTQLFTRNYLLIPPTDTPTQFL